MTEEGRERPKLTLEDVLDKVHREVGEAITVMGIEISNIPDFISTFFHSRTGWTDIYVEGYRRMQALSYQDLVERAKTLFDQARDIWLEKGYRHLGSLDTAREHKEVASSGYGQFEVMPDTVVQIANRTLKLYEEKEPMTVEEIRRARILVGKSIIDDTGTVTGEIMPITDSYHFLSEARKVEVKELESRIISGLRDIVHEAIARKVSGLTKYKNVIRSLAEGWVPRMAAYTQLEELSMPLEVAEEAVKLAYQNGRKDNILTPMEITLLGRKVDDEYVAKPHTPLGIQRGIFSVEEANAVE